MVDVVRAAELSDGQRTDPQRAPFYDDGFVKVWHGDARALPLADGSVNLVITSPPFNCRAAYDGYEDWLPWNEYWHELIEPSMRECFRVLAPGGRLAVNLANVVRQDVNSERLQVQSRPTWRWKPPRANGEAWSVMVAPRLWAALEQIGFLPREQLTWIKTLAPEDIVTSTAWGSWRSARNPALRAVAEPVFIASKITHSRSAGASDLTSDEFKAWTRNVWAIPAGHVERDFDHPCKFPPELPRRLIKLYSYIGDVVLDPFCGSGTTLRVAKDLRRQAIGVDISRSYCAMSANRCRQQLLFLGDGHASSADA